VLDATVRVYKERNMSGPVATDDAAPVPGAAPQVAGPVVELSPARLTQVGSLPVRRVLPQRPRRTVGSWCFLDHAGPVAAEPGVSFGIGPHPHLGLQTVTWLLEGELLHLDSLGSEQLIRPGQLNLMTAGHGVAHAEEDPAQAEEVHAVQLWVAQPAGTREGPAAFEHHAELPRLDLDHAGATVLVGDFAGMDSPARRDTAHMGVELALRGPQTVVPLRPDYEYALVVLEGRVTVDGVAVEPGVLAYLGLGRDECALGTEAPARALLVGGVPFPEPILMWWNFVGRTREELSEARRQWSADDGRFGRVRSSLERIEVGRPPWE
jgi:quercetin 2,3-dioxygenase